MALSRIFDLASLHQALQPLMFCAVQCMRPTVYDWSTSLLSNMKQQLSDCKMGRVRNFSFNSILSMFFFEHVLGLSLDLTFLLMGFDIWPNAVGKMLCADLAKVGCPTPTQLIYFHGGGGRSLP